VPATRSRLERPPLDRDSVERFGHEGGEPAWLVEARLAAADRYLETPWPRSDVGEEWRRFPLKDVPYDLLAGSLPEPAVRGPDEPGVLNLPLQEAVRKDGLARTWVERVPGGCVAQAAIRAYAAAAWTAGRFVRVAAGVEAARPIDVITGPGISRTIVVAERASRATIVEELRSQGDEERVAMPVLEVHLEDDAAIDYIQIQRFGPQVWLLGSQYYRSGRSSRLASFNVVVGGRANKVGVGSDIVGDGAVVTLNGLVAAGGDQKVDFNVFQDLAGSHSESILLYLAALYDRAKAVTYGVIRVEPQSRATSSYQECRNLLLSEHAGADPIPVLEILTNDVLRCGHGATAGAMDPVELFYVMSRGLPRDDAERLIVRGFFERVVEKVAHADVRRRMLSALEPRIGTIGALEATA
jgi:Fe-S cluster assembly protein SufD